MAFKGLQDLQLTVKGFYEHKGFNSSPQTLVLGLMEEVGELAEAMLLNYTADFVPSNEKALLDLHPEDDVAYEVGDCITYLLALCNRLRIEPKFKHF